MAVPTKLTALRNAIDGYDVAHGLHVVIWTDTDLSLVYTVVGNLENFDPTAKVQIKSSPINADGTYGTPQVVYGVATAVQVQRDQFAIKIQNFASAQSDSTKRLPGDILYGVYKDTIDFTQTATDWITWSFVAGNTSIHRQKQPVLELCENASLNPTPPGGAYGVEYERNADGTLVVDANGSPKIALIDPAGGNVQANLKVGQLVMSFTKDFFAPGVHAWQGSGGAAGCTQFLVVLTPQSPGPLVNLTINPGTINQLVPANILTTFVYDPTTSVFVKLNVTTNGKAITGATIAVDGTPTGAIDTAANAAPLTFQILLAVVIKGTVFQVRTCNIRAIPLAVIQEGVMVPVPGTSPYIFYYTWQLAEDE